MKQKKDKINMTFSFIYNLQKNSNVRLYAFMRSRCIYTQSLFIYIYEKYLHILQNKLIII